MMVKLLTEHHLEYVSLKGGCRGSPESTLVKMPYCCKSHAMADMEKQVRKVKVLYLCLVCGILILDREHDLSVNTNY